MKSTTLKLCGCAPEYISPESHILLIQTETVFLGSKPIDNSTINDLDEEDYSDIWG